MISGCRYSRAIRQSLNKTLGRSSLNRALADLITEFSHKIPLIRGNYLISPMREYFVIKEVLSQHWVTGFFCPPRAEFMPTCVIYHPNFSRRTRIQKKRLFDPFGVVSIRCRNRTFKQRVNEPYTNLATIFA